MDQYTAKRIHDAVWEDQALCEDCIYRRNVSEPYSIGDRTVLAAEYECTGTPEQCMDRVYRELRTRELFETLAGLRDGIDEGDMR